MSANIHDIEAYCATEAATTKTDKKINGFEDLRDVLEFVE